MAHPVQIINHRARAHLQIDWDDGRHQVLSHQLLRTACRCADCRALDQRGQSRGDAREVRLDDVAAVGHYGVQLSFSDGHVRGIYPWSFLYALDMDGDI